MLVLEGCVQPAMAPNINAAAARVLDRLGISLSVATGAGCCGAASHHTSGVTEGLDFARRNIDAWWPSIEAGAEAIVMTASGCGVHVKDYGHLLEQDPAYAAKAKRVAELTQDISEILTKENLAALKPAGAGVKLAFHAPCTLQHGQKLAGVVEKILRDAGFTLTLVADAHLCCGSAGTYSLLQPALARRLRENKIQSLQSGGPDLMVTANIGCLAHLQGRSERPLRHWIEVMDGSAGRRRQWPAISHGENVFINAPVQTNTNTLSRAGSPATLSTRTLKNLRVSCFSAPAERRSYPVMSGYGRQGFDDVLGQHPRRIR